MTALNWLIAAVIIAAVMLSVLSTDPGIIGIAPKLFFWLEVGFSAFFLIEYIARLWTSAEAPGKDGAWAKRWRFAKSPMGVIDFIVAFSAIAPLLAPDIESLSMVRILRLLLLFKLGRFSSALGILFKAIVSRRYELFVTMLLASMLLLFGATALFLAEGDAQPDKFGSVPRALWWSIITLTTVGYGDVAPITPLGKFLASIVALAGIGMVALPTGILAAAFSDAMQHRREHIPPAEDVDEEEATP